MRKAVIDLGTNTFNLLIAEVDGNRFNTIISTKIGVALGMGGILEHRISPEAFDRGMSALKEFKELCDEHEVKTIIAIGTSALRDASNGQEFRSRALDEIGRAHV